MAPTTEKEFTVPEFFKACGINSIGNTLLSSRNTIVLDKYGDLLIELNASDSQKSCGNEENKPPVPDNSDSESTNLKRLYRFKVCSRTMRRASAVWNAMLFGPWLEGKRADGGEWVVAVEGDQPFPLAVVLAIIHGCPEQIPTWNADAHGARAAVSGILSTADKYDVMRLLQPFVKKFLPYAEPQKKLDKINQYDVLDEYDSLGVLYTLNIAWHLGAVDHMEQVLRHLGVMMSSKQLNMLLGHAQNCPRLGIPVDICELLDGVRTYQELAIQSYLDFFHGSVERRANGETEWSCKKPMLEGTGAATVMNGAVSFLKDEAAMDKLLQLYKLQQQQCNALLLGQIVDRVHHYGSKTFPKQAKEVETCLDTLIKDICCAFSLDGCSKLIFLPGHEECTRTPSKEFWRFEYEQDSQHWYEPALEPGQLEWLRLRGEVLGTVGYW